MGGRAAFAFGCFRGLRRFSFAAGCRAVRVVRDTANTETDRQTMVLDSPKAKEDDVCGFFGQWDSTLFTPTAYT